ILLEVESNAWLTITRSPCYSVVSFLRESGQRRLWPGLGSLPHSEARAISTGSSLPIHRAARRLLPFPTSLHFQMSQQASISRVQYRRVLRIRPVAPLLPQSLRFITFMPRRLTEGSMLPIGATFSTGTMASNIGLTVSWVISQHRLIHQRFSAPWLRQE